MVANLKVQALVVSRQEEQSTPSAGPSSIGMIAQICSQ
jgi:hypothetical protein